jgi:hypothetical protein
VGLLDFVVFVLDFGDLFDGEEGEPLVFEFVRTCPFAFACPFAVACRRVFVFKFSAKAVSVFVIGGSSADSSSKNPGTHTHSGSHASDTLDGRGGVRGPYMRPRVEAAVSAQERLRR